MRTKTHPRFFTFLSLEELAIHALAIIKNVLITKNMLLMWKKPQVNSKQIHVLVGRRLILNLTLT